MFCLEYTPRQMRASPKKYVCCGARARGGIVDVDAGVLYGNARQIGVRSTGSVCADEKQETAARPQVVRMARLRASLNANLGLYVPARARVRTGCFCERGSELHSARHCACLNARDRVWAVHALSRVVARAHKHAWVCAHAPAAARTSRRGCSRGPTRPTCTSRAGSGRPAGCAQGDKGDRGSTRGSG
eukprot:233364-Pleurochrysis_carterae.AAC.1